MIDIKTLKKPMAKDLAAINGLMAKMSLGAVPPKPVSVANFREILGQPELEFLVAVPSGGDDIIGIVCVYFIRIPSGLIAVAEDLVVDDRYHKWGVGRLLMEAGVDLAKRKKARHISLRTNPKREEAVKLYEAMGFHKMETNFYRINLHG